MLKRWPRPCKILKKKIWKWKWLKRWWTMLWVSLHSKPGSGGHCPTTFLYHFVRDWFFILESAFAESGDEEEADNIMNQVSFFVIIITSIFRIIVLSYYSRSLMKSELKLLDQCHVHQQQRQRIQANLIK